MKFDHSKKLYTVKKANYISGVKKEDFYYWFCSRANLDETIQNDFDHNELYVKKDDEYEKYSKAVLLNRDKGLVVILV